MINQKQEGRILARQFAQSTVISAVDLKGLAGGGGGMGYETGQTTPGCDFGPTQGSACSRSDNIDCDLDWITND